MKDMNNKQGLNQEFYEAATPSVDADLLKEAVKAYMEITGFSDLSSDDMRIRTSGVAAVIALVTHHYDATKLKAVDKNGRCPADLYEGLEAYRSHDGSVYEKFAVGFNAIMNYRLTRPTKEPTLEEEVLSILHSNKCTTAELAKQITALVQRRSESK